jgi:hypothetical protein
MDEAERKYALAKALRLAASGQYEDWREVCQKMIRDNIGHIALFDEGAVCSEVDVICNSSRPKAEG